MPPVFMLKPSVPQSFVDSLKAVRKGLMLGWDQKVSRFFIAHEHEYTGLRRVIRYCENEDMEGSFRMPDMRDIVYVQKFVDWNKIDMYPEVKDMFDAMIQEKNELKIKKMKQRNKWVQDFIKDNKKRVREAMRNFFSDGYVPDKPIIKAKKIFVDTGEYKQSNGGLLVPKFSKGE